MRGRILLLWLFASCSLVFPGCKSSSDLLRLEKSAVTPLLMLAEERSPRGAYTQTVVQEQNNIEQAEHTPDNRLVMNAVLENGSYIAIDTLQSVRITAKSKHIPERGGKLSIPFNIVIPVSLMNDRWQIRITPKLFWQTDSLEMEKIVLTGNEFEKSRLSGIGKYNKFLSSIVTDSSEYLAAFGYLKLIENFCKRNVGNKFYNANRAEAEEYYINKWLLNSNNRKIKSVGEKYRQWCAEFEKQENVRLDTLIAAPFSEMVYKYLQDVDYQRNMNRLRVAFSAEIVTDAKQHLQLSGSDTLTYYITSIAEFVSAEPLFVDKVIERRVSRQSSAYITFKEGEWEVVDTLSNNRAEIDKIYSLFEDLQSSSDFEIDSISVVANCSPEGSYRFNTMLAQNRSKSLSVILDRFAEGKKIPVSNHYVPEDWDGVKTAILSDTLIKDKVYLLESYKIEDYDLREKHISASPDYNYLRDNIYPQLRKIDVNFYLHRRGMIKDTIHSHEPDLNYKMAQEALKERDYGKACLLLNGYKCLNHAIALMGMERNMEALAILNVLPDAAVTNYLKAMAYSRIGKFDLAIEKLDLSVAEDDNLVFRIKFDPEINRLADIYKRNYSISN